jgi:uncharacterized protein (DUF433 family)
MAEYSSVKKGSSPPSTQRYILSKRFGMVTKQIGFDYKKRFERDPHICGGQWIIKGTRIPVRTILASLAEGASVDEILRDFPTLREADIKAVIAFSAAMVQENLQIS